MVATDNVISLGDRISIYLGQIDMIAVAGRKYSEAKVLTKELDGLREENKRLSQYLETTIEERNKLRKQLEESSAELQAKNDELSKMESTLAEKDLKIGKLQGAIEAKASILKFYRAIFGEKVKNVAGAIKGSLEKGEQGQSGKDGGS